MRTFDILDPNAELYGSKILEASAGTGKTFAIEHIVVRLLLEGSIEIEEILAITYTRAAAREMRMRIRENIKAALAALYSEKCVWPYLAKSLGSKEAVRRLERALAGFDGAQIFTIHGFCQRMLSEFFLEARYLQPGADEAAPLGKALRKEVLDFLETQQTLCPEQMQELLKKKKILRLSKDLLNQPVSLEKGNFLEDCRAIEEAVRRAPHANAQEDFARIETLCKYTDFNRTKIAIELQALGDLLQNPSSTKAIRTLFRWKGQIFRFVSRTNRKKGKEDLFQPPLFDWCEEHLQPLLEKAMDARLLFQKLRSAWQQPFEALLEEKGLFSPDFLLERMRRSLAYPDFAAKIRGRTKAVIIDEFQDTDAVQWEIFSTLFQDLPLFYLVGDPKQSIYRFRNADLYTYYHARESLGQDASYSLDTNYRSSPKLVSALNDLFGEKHVEPWLWLPQEKRTEPYHPVKAGLKEAPDLGDDLKPLQFFKVESLKEDAFFYIAKEIQRLRPSFSGYNSFAVLVQSNQQGALIQDYLEKLSLPCSAKSRSTLGSTLAMQMIEELFDALFFPRDPSSIKRFLAGPFEAGFEHLFFWKETLDRKGMAFFFREFFKTCHFYEKIVGFGTAFFRDFFQLAEQLIQKEPKSYEAIARIFREIEEADPDEDTSVRRRMDAGEDAVQILTMHTSKGLEFDVVFALGAATPTPASLEDPEETEAEKLRQLYVALTRAKRRLYVPLASVKMKAGGEPPLELLWRRSKLGGIEKLIEISPHIGLSVSSLASDIETVSEEKSPISSPEILSFPKPLGMVYSYTALAGQERGGKLPPLEAGKSIQTLPRGAEVGTLFHRIFERIFTEETGVSEIVEEEISFSELAGWKEIVLETVQQALSLPLFDGVSLNDLNRSEIRAEVEFFFHAPPHFFKGCIDLLFLWQGRLYFLDWKTNWLENYSEANLQKAMDEHNYWMQASLYAEAIRRAWPNASIGKAVYLFLRGGVLSFEPEPFRINSR